MDAVIDHLPLCRRRLAIGLLSLELGMGPQSLPAMGSTQVGSQGGIGCIGVADQSRSPSRHGVQVEGSRR